MIRKQEPGQRQKNYNHLFPRKFYLLNVVRNLMDKLAIHKNISLITGSGTVGKVALVPKHWVQWIPSDHIICVVPAK